MESPATGAMMGEKGIQQVAVADQSEQSVVDQIAECAERIVALLRRIRQTNILQLSDHLPDRSPLIYQALGWLACEGRIGYERHGNQVYVLLRPDTE